MRKVFLTVTMLTAAIVAVAQDIIITYNGDNVKVKQTLKDSITIDTNGSHVSVNSKYKQKEVVIRLQGKSNDGTFHLTSAGKSEVELYGLSLNSNEGAPLWLSNKKRVKISAKADTDNTLSITACKDTANNKGAVIWAKNNLRFTGKGTLNINAIGDGCKGIYSKKNIEIKNLTLNIVTKGNNLGKKDFHLGGPMGGPMPNFNFDELPDSVKAFIEEMRKNGPQFPPGGMMPGGAPGGGMTFGQGGAMPFAQGGGMPFGQGAPSGDPDETIVLDGFKQRYIRTTKGIKANGTITIESGKVTCKTSSAGAEGIEGKKGITINGGEVTVDAVDDAINSNNVITFNGGKVIAESHTNDAVDANMPGGMAAFFGNFSFPGQPKQEATPKEKPQPAIIINGGEVYAWSHLGNPEEGLDCDFAPIEVAGGKIFSIGAGMGDMPSVPTEETAKHPTALLIGVNLTKGDKLKIREGGKVIATIDVPFTFMGSSSLLTIPAFKAGSTYIVSIGDISRTFTFDKNFITVSFKEQQKP